MFERVGLLDESIKDGTDDYEFVVRVALAGMLKWSGSRRPVTVRHEHGGNFTNPDRMYRGAVRVLGKYWEHGDFSVRRAARDRVGWQLFRVARAWHRAERWHESVRAYRGALSYAGKMGPVFGSKALLGAVLARLRVRV
ncbi:MAG: hypothetical protein IMX01_10450 [Limnochordaceae bacterium]|nr:hypothetical protein [Limnochordaceae bacterium]